MKKIIIKGLVALSAVTLASCSSDYLDLAPVTTITEETAVGTEQGTQAALTGMYLTQYMQPSLFGGGAHRMMNGEAWINWYHGEAYGQDYYHLMWADGIYSSYIVNWEGMDVDDYWFSQVAWIYYYTIINQANNIIYGIDRCDASQTFKDQVVAQCKAMRAHCYTRLLEIYAPRWEDSNNGETAVLVNRIADKNYGGSPLVSMNTTFELIYSDLDDAIAKMTETKFKRSQPHEIDLQVAQGYYARAALLKHDYKTAQVMAKAARQGHPIMSSDEYLSGFTYANKEYICYIAPTDMMPVGYSGTYWTTGCNGPYMEGWENYGAGAINYDLYRKMDPNDIRRALFWTPDKMSSPEVNLPKWDTAGFWNTKYVSSSNMDMSNLVQGMYKNIRKYAQSENLAGGRNSALPQAYARYKASSSSSSNLTVPFGAQFKFWAWSTYGTADLCLMRAAEMLLTEAEAAYYNGDMATVKANLEELNKQRVPGYTCDKTGEALLEEYKLNRRLELWGEGFSWFDLKRWNEPMSRRAWIEGDPTSNNIPVFNAITMNPSDHHGWRFALPRAEAEYNDAVDRDKTWGSTDDASRSIQSKPTHDNPFAVKF